MNLQSAEMKPLHLSLLGELSEPVEATFTCDSRLWLFVDGRSVKFTKSWRQPVTYTFPAGSRLVAVQCRANRQTGTAGILGSFRNGLVTDGRWKCTRLDKYKINWKQIDYDDHAWPTAVEFFSNKEETPIYKKIGGISEHASWIWTADKAVGIVVGCRRILSDLVPRKQEKGMRPAVALTQISAYSTHKNLAVRKIIEVMRTAYAKSGIQSQHVSN